LAGSLFPAVTANLELSRYFARIHLWADESPAEESPWFSFAPVQGEDGDRRELTLFCSSRSFAPVRNLQGPESAARQVWEAHEGAWLPDNELHRDFDLDQGAKFLHHNLLLARDLVSGEGQLDRVPRELVEGYQAAWEVVIDGRLARLSLPGYSLAERRARFSRLFSSAGVLLPDHWQVFQSLWEGGLSTGGDVRAVLRQLPQL
jgi:hypothetical protein